jgi:putative membrane protein
MRPALVLSLAGLAFLLGACSGHDLPRTPGLGDAERGRVVVGREACGSCHVIPGLQDADGAAGPPLDAFARRTVIAGVLPNRPEALVRWLRSPQAVVPGNAMPDMALTEQQAGDVAAYLETLR